MEQVTSSWRPDSFQRHAAEELRRFRIARSLCEIGATQSEAQKIVRFSYIGAASARVCKHRGVAHAALARSRNAFLAWRRALIVRRKTLLPEHVSQLIHLSRRLLKSW